MKNRVALCGVMCALSVVLLSLVALIPGTAYCCLLLASLPPMLLMQLCGTKYALTAFAATAFLSLLLAPDKELAALYLALGYYPILRPRLERLPKAAGWVCKLLWFYGSLLLLYAVLLFVLRPTVFTQGFTAPERWILMILLPGGGLVFVLYDWLLPRLSQRLADRFSRFF